MHSLHSETVICSWPIVAIDLAVCIFVVSLALDSNLDLANWHTDGSPTHNDAKHLPMPLLEDFTKETPTPNWKISVHGG
jgi:hypothetical protein